MASRHYQENIQPILIKLLWLIFAIVIALLLGLMIGSMIGGRNPFAVFLPSTWTHIAEFLK